jgi:hypothetical protein
LERTFKEDPKILVPIHNTQSLYHTHDYSKILIKMPPKVGEVLPSGQNKALEEFKEKMIAASEKSPISQDFDGVFNPIGKLFIVIHKISLNWKKHMDDETIMIRIHTGALVYESRPIVYTKEIIINQGFLMYPPPLTQTHLQHLRERADQGVCCQR